MTCINVKENCPVQFCRDCEFYNPTIHDGDIVYTTKEEEFKCLKCIYYDPDKYQLNGYGEKLPDTCLTGSQYYCVVSGYSLFKINKS